MPRGAGRPQLTRGPQATTREARPDSPSAHIKDRFIGVMRLQDSLPVSLDDDPFFKDAQDSFEKMKERMKRETEQFWKRVDADHKKMIQDAEDDWKNWEKNSGKFYSFENGDLEGRKGAVANNASKNDSTHDILKDHHLKFKGITEDANKMEMEVDTSEYLPGELRVTVEVGTVRVVGDHQERDKGGKVVRSLRFDQSFTLPPSARGEEVRGHQGSLALQVWCRLGAEGRLVVTAPKARGGSHVREVPIITGSGGTKNI